MSALNDKVVIATGGSSGIGRAGGDRAAAKACFLGAIAFAREQSAKLCELRATTGLASDLRDAKALLDELTTAGRPLLLRDHGAARPADTAKADPRHAVGPAKRSGERGRSWPS